MTFLSPLAIGLVGLSVPVILMYILKLRRQPKVVSSTFLWRRALDDVQANAPWQRLRLSALLLLQLLALLALVLIQTRPAYSSTERYRGDLIVIIDQSFGMQATDVAPSRFVAAQNRAKTLAAQVPAGNVVSVIGMGLRPTLAIAEGTEQGAIDSAVDHLQPLGGQPNFLEALSLASSLARNGQATRVVVLTSRESGINTLPLHTSFAVQIIRIGSNLHDVGISDFGANAGKGGVSALVRVQNFGYARESTDLNLYVDGQLADVRPLSLAPGSQTLQFWSKLPSSANLLRVVLTHHDDVAIDKQAWTIATSGEVWHVLLVSPGDFFLQTALSVNSSVRLTVEKASQYTPGQSRRFDLTVFDQSLPSTLPAGPVLLVGPSSGSVGGFSFGKFVTGGSVVVNPGLPTDLAPIAANVDVSDVHVARERSASFPGFMQPVFTSAGQTLVSAGESSGGRRIAVMTFADAETDWPLRISFPIVIQNLVQYLVPSVGVSSTAIAAGAPVTLSAAPAVKEIDVTLPDGSMVRLRRPFTPFTDTSQPGVYAVRERGRSFSSRFVVNVLPVRPAPTTGPKVETLGRSISGGSHKTSIPAELNWIAALLCLGLLGTEWWLAFRR